MIQKFLLNLALAAVFVALQGSASFIDIVLGLLIGLGVVSMLSNASGNGGYTRRVFGLVRFAFYFIYILIKANLEVAWEVITPGHHMQPRLLRYSVAGLTEVEITTLANAITLTPGTLSADINDAGDTLYIHCMYAREREDAVAALDELRHWLLREVFDHDC
ncbi:MAG: Na+/H+ antiporter subunit E [Algisphaera sp.]